MLRYAFILLFFGSAAAAEPLDLAVTLPDFEACAETLCPARHSPWERRELVGEAMGRWLGVRNGRWDAFSGKLFEEFENGPVISGTIRKNAAQIQLRWRPGG
jgi:hypothetical protein